MDSKHLETLTALEITHLQKVASNAAMEQEKDNPLVSQ